MNKISCLVLFLFASMSNADVMTAGDVTNNGGGSFTLTSGNGSVSDSAIESFIGLTAGGLDALSTGDATEGSAITDTFNIASGDTFSFDWLWTSNEGDGVDYNDFAFVNLSFDGVALLADTFTPDGTSGSFSWMATTSGMLTYGIGVMDVNDTLVASTLTVNNISATVAEPSAIALLALGFAGVGFARRK